MRSRFQQGLDELRQKLLRMGGLAEQAVDRACQAYSERDLMRCHMVLENEALINAAEREIDELAFDLLALQQPMAVDLRFILAVTKINSDLERVGDQAVNIAERVMENLRRQLDCCVLDLYRIVGPEYFTPPYLPPAMFRRFVLPHVTEMTRLIHERGAKVRLHCHGSTSRPTCVLIHFIASALVFAIVPS